MSSKAQADDVASNRSTGTCLNCASPKLSRTGRRAYSSIMFILLTTLCSCTSRSSFAYSESGARTAQGSFAPSSRIPRVGQVGFLRKADGIYSGQMVTRRRPAVPM
jgi:hypothetical protein